MYDYLIVGSGLYGAVFAQVMREHGKRCLVIDKRAHTGGNVYTSVEEGITVHRYGAHIFHTDNEAVWQYINRFARFNHFVNAPLAYSGGGVYNLPFNMNTFNRLWGVVTPAEAREKIAEQCAPYRHIVPKNLEEQALQLCGPDIYHRFIKGYTEKQWGRRAEELPGEIIRRIPLRFTYDNNYFNDHYQGIPTGGYQSIIRNLLEGTEVKTHTDYLHDRSYWDSVARKVVYTGCIDAYFEKRFGELTYRSLRFEHEHIETPDYQGNAVVNYNDAEVPFTRIIEHKHFEFGQQPTTIITREYPQPYVPGSEPYYPVGSEEDRKRLARYRALAKETPHVRFGGRLGQYAYLDMDDTIAAALQAAREELTTEPA